MITVDIVADSINPKGVRLTTILAKYPRFILAELNTHRVFSRNTASSRAVPVKKMLEYVRNEPAEFVHCGINCSGMQAHESMPEDAERYFRARWRRLGHMVANEVEDILSEMNAYFSLTPHKQMINRAIEPWLHVQTVISATDWDNFFNLRCHEDAQPEMRELAEKIRDAMRISEPVELSDGGWHIPFIDKEEQNLPLETKLKVSTARCARTSYFYHDGKKSMVEKDIQLHDRLIASDPKHSSPAEHQAMAVDSDDRFYNFRGFRQYRHFVDFGEM